MSGGERPTAPGREGQASGRRGPIPHEGDRVDGRGARRRRPRFLHRRPQQPPPRNTTTLPRRGLRFLRARWPVLVRLAAWSVLETGQTFLVGYGLARALDAGFLVGRGQVGLAWLGVAGVGVVVGAFGTGRVYRGVADLVTSF